MSVAGKAGPLEGGANRDSPKLEARGAASYIENWADVGEEHFPMEIPAVRASHWQLIELEMR